MADKGGTEAKAKANAKIKLADLVRKEKITFVLDSWRHDWPSTHADLFEDVWSKGRVDFLAFAEDAERERDHQPWMMISVFNAERLTAKAVQAVNERQSEMGWRVVLEHEIFAPLANGTSCQSCHDRIWRAYGEPPVGGFDPIAKSTDKRREQRKPCTCLSDGRGLDRRSAVSAMFSVRASEKMSADPTSEAVPEKKLPDLIYGLRRWKDYDSHMSQIRRTWDEAGTPSNSAAHDLFGPAVYMSPEEPLLFPFLVLEAKRETEAAGFLDIGVQAALPLKRLLLLQHQLRTAGRMVRSAFLEPLVWFLATRGDCVRVYASYAEEHADGIHCKVHCLFDGRITSREGALRLILVVQGIATWARDTYVPTIQHQLRMVAEPESDLDSVHGASQATTMRPRLGRLDRPPVPTQHSSGKGCIREEEEQDEKEEEEEEEDALHIEQDTPFGWVRPSWKVESRFSALILDSTNIHIFEQSLFQCAGRDKSRPRKQTPQNTPEKAKSRPQDIFEQVPRRVLRLFDVPKNHSDHRCLISEHTVNRIEELWTHQVGGKQPSSPERLSMWASITVTFYLTHNWQIVRELSCIAISSSALRTLADSYDKRTKPRSEPSEIPSETLETLIEEFKDVPATRQLAASFTRCSLSIPRLATLVSSRSSVDAVELVDVPGLPMEHRGCTTSDSMAHELMLYLKEFGPGKIEYSSNFLRISSLSENHKGGHSTPAIAAYLPNLKDDNSVAVVAHGSVSNLTRFKQENGQHGIPNQCMFVLKRSVLQQWDGTAQVLRDTLLGWQVYQTIRREWRYLQSRGNDQNPPLCKYTRFDSEVYMLLYRWIQECGVEAPDPAIPFPPRGDLTKTSYRHGSVVVGVPCVPDWWRELELKLVRDHEQQCVETGPSRSQPKSVPLSLSPLGSPAYEDAIRSSSHQPLSEQTLLSSVPRRRYASWTHDRQHQVHETVFPSTESVTASPEAVLPCDGGEMDRQRLHGLEYGQHRLHKSRSETVDSSELSRVTIDLTGDTDDSD